MYQGRLAPVSNRGTWIEQLALTDQDTGNAIDITGYNFAVEVRDPATKAALLTASTANGGVVTLDATGGIAEFTFPESQMDDLCAGVYEVGVTAELNGVVTQLIIASLQVLDGVVT